MAVVDLSAFASVESNLDAGLGLDLVQISGKGIVNVFAYVFGDVPTEASAIQRVGKAGIHAKFTFQAMRHDTSNLYVVAVGLKVLDQVDRTITIAKRGVEDEIPTPLYCRRTQLLGPLAGVFMCVAGPRVRVLLAQESSIRMSAAKLVRIDLYNIIGKLKLNSGDQSAFARARLSGQDDGSRHRLACDLVQTRFRKDDIPEAGSMGLWTQSRMRSIHLGLFSRCLEILVQFMETFHSAVAGARSEHQLEFLVSRCNGLRITGCLSGSQLTLSIIDESVEAVLQLPHCILEWR